MKENNRTIGIDDAAFNREKSTKTFVFGVVVRGYSLVEGVLRTEVQIDGISATKKIRKVKGYENLPIVAVTALAMKGQKELFLSEGCSHYISKPFESKTFVKLIKEIIYNGKPAKE